jgi:hypothetical protein
MRIMNDRVPGITSEERLRRALSLVGELLEARRYRVDVVIIGGSAMLLGGLNSRPTRDVDIVAFVVDGALTRPARIPDPLARAAAATALELGLEPEWLNLGPTDLLDAGLPNGFFERCTVEQFGGLTAFVADRYDLIHFKTFAAVDQGPTSKHYVDLRELRPSRGELLSAARWCRTQDPSDAFAGELVELLETFGITDA